MHALEPRRIDEDLEHRLGFGQSRHLGRIELERQIRARTALAIATPEVRSRHRLNQRQILTEYPILGKILDRIERGLDRSDLFRRARAGTGAAFRIEAHLEQCDKLLGDVAVHSERGLDKRLRQWKPDLAQVFRTGAQYHDLLRRQPRRDDETVELVVLDLAAENLSERGLENRVQGIDFDFGVV